MERRRPTRISDRPRSLGTLAWWGMNLEITPQPSEEERAAIEAALGQEAREGRPSAWAGLLLPQRGEDPETEPPP